MNKYLFLIIFMLSLVCCNYQTYGQVNYLAYHHEISRCEQLISERKFSAAVNTFDSLFHQFDFVFLRDCKLAAELSIYEGDREASFQFLRKGILQGWTLKRIKKDKKLRPLQNDPEWNRIESEYDSLHLRYLARINNKLRDQTHYLYKKDQKMAFRALFRIGEKSQTKYAERKFAPHSEKQLADLYIILVEQGYPGEKLIGNSWWVSVILSHHNSISKDYALQDSLYLNLRPMLIEAIDKGELHPYEFATIEDWRMAALYQHDSTSYGYLGKITDPLTLEEVNLNRSAIGLRTIVLRNNMIDLERETGLNLYLPKGWQKGKIMVAHER